MIDGRLWIWIETRAHEKLLHWEFFFLTPFFSRKEWFIKRHSMTFWHFIALTTYKSLYALLFHSPYHNLNGKTTWNWSIHIKLTDCIGELCGVGKRWMDFVWRHEALLIMSGLREPQWFVMRIYFFLYKYTYMHALESGFGSERNFFGIFLENKQRFFEKI